MDGWEISKRSLCLLFVLLTTPLVVCPSQERITPTIDNVQPAQSTVAVHAYIMGSHMRGFMYKEQSQLITMLRMGNQ